MFPRGHVSSANSHSIDGTYSTKEKGCQFAKCCLSFWVILPHLQKKFMHAVPQTVPKQKVHLHDKRKV